MGQPILTQLSTVQPYVQELLKQVCLELWPTQFAEYQRRQEHPSTDRPDGAFTNLVEQIDRANDEGEANDSEAFSQLDPQAFYLERQFGNEPKDSEAFYQMQ